MQIRSVKFDMLPCTRTDQSLCWESNSDSQTNWLANVAVFIITKSANRSIVLLYYFEHNCMNLLLFKCCWFRYVFYLCYSLYFIAFLLLFSFVDVAVEIVIIVIGFFLFLLLLLLSHFNRCFCFAFVIYLKQFVCFSFHLKILKKKNKINKNF